MSDYKKDAEVLRAAGNSPIYIEYYSHDNCDCFKIDLPWSQFVKDVRVLCPVSSGIDYAKLLAVGVIQAHLAEVLALPLATEEKE